jgi:hypothetical protein
MTFHQPDQEDAADEFGPGKNLVGPRADPGTARKAAFCQMPNSARETCTAL